MNIEELPQGWASASLSLVCDKIQDGTHFSPKDQLAEGRYLYITAKNVKPAGLNLSDVTYLSEEDHRDIYERCDPRYGDVLLVKDGVNTGDVAINTLHEEISLLSSVCMLRPKSVVLDNHYLRHYLQSPVGGNYLLGKMSGTAIKRVILKKIKDSPILLAPLAEQRRIVARIEELFAELDAAVEELERVRANLKRYRAAVLKAAVTGDLTADWRSAHPNAEPASVLLERILTDRRAKWEADQLAKFAADKKTPPKNWQAKYAEPSKPDTSKLPRLPEGWCWANLDQLLEGIESGKSFKCQTRKANSDEWAVIKVSAMTWGTFLEEEQKALQPKAPFDPYDEVRPGDLLLSRCNTTELVGATVLVGACRPKLLLSDKSLRLLLVPGIDRTWLHKALSSSVIRRQLSAMATGTSDSMRNVSQEKIVSVVVPLPPLAEQEAIVLEVEARLSDVTAAEAVVNANLTRAARLRQSILKEAFAGRLVPQDPADEPAAVLFERLRAAKNSAAAGVVDSGGGADNGRRQRKARKSG